ncbi:uncharacterized protein LOC131247115 [Magnolia sinica]|uniref:uncharacterized protein LOC131247115 n=1 Tax=Magnolia sinica TaxID=86752 RepID=UPI0026583275|nr:uncharacterized protein LOC131247115 [Magnolia sinica]
MKVTLQERRAKPTVEGTLCRLEPKPAAGKGPLLNQNHGCPNLIRPFPSLHRRLSRSAPLSLSTSPSPLDLSLPLSHRLFLSLSTLEPTHLPLSLSLSLSSILRHEPKTAVVVLVHPARAEHQVRPDLVLLLTANSIYQGHRHAPELNMDIDRQVKRFVL